MQGTAIDFGSKAWRLPKRAQETVPATLSIHAPSRDDWARGVTVLVRKAEVEAILTRLPDGSLIVSHGEEAWTASPEEAEASAAVGLLLQSGTRSIAIEAGAFNLPPIPPTAEIILLSSRRRSAS